jgi:hypothetical protein
MLRDGAIVFCELWYFGNVARKMKLAKQSN